MTILSDTLHKTRSNRKKSTNEIVLAIYTNKLGTLVANVSLRTLAQVI
jgi:hypothetical protein